MAQPPSPPTLTPQFCFHPDALRTFLRLSRSTLDDTISTHLNSLLTPSTTSPFTPSSTNEISPTSRRPKRPIDNRTCQSFVSQILLPTWSARDDTLHYCSAVATSPDPSDPEAVAREAENMKAQSRIIDERLDPYSARYFPKEARTEALAGLIRNEKRVEQIVRQRVWRIVSERCEGIGSTPSRSGEEAWEEALRSWRDKEKGKGMTKG